MLAADPTRRALTQGEKDWNQETPPDLPTEIKMDARLRADRAYGECLKNIDPKTAYSIKPASENEAINCPPYYGAQGACPGESLGQR